MYGDNLWASGANQLTMNNNAIKRIWPEFIDLFKWWLNG